MEMIVLFFLWFVPLILVYFICRYFNRIDEWEMQMEKSVCLFCLGFSLFPFVGIVISIILGAIYLYHRFIKNRESFMGFK